MQLIAPRTGATPRRGRWVVVPESKKTLARSSWRRGQRTRLRIFELMIGAVIGSLIAALLWKSDNAWLVQACCDASLALYCMLLIEAKRRRHQRAIAVRRRRQRPQFRRRPQVVWVTPARAGVDRR